jgi:hypothetical protein
MSADPQAMRDRVAVLEFELAEVLRKDNIAALQIRYGLTRQRAALLAYMLDGRLKTYDGALVAIGSAAKGCRNSVSVQLSGIRKTMPWLKIVSVWGAGHYLAPESIERIKSEMAEQ